MKLETFIGREYYVIGRRRRREEDGMKSSVFM